MRKIIIGLILGFVLTLPFTVKAYEKDELQYLAGIEYLLEEIRDNGDDMLDKMETILDRL